MRTLMALLFALTLQTAQSRAEPWQVVKPDGLAFSIEFPAKPQDEEDSVDLGDGKSALMRTFQIMEQNTIFDVTVASYPKGLLQSIGEETVLDNARDGAVNNAPGPLLSETKIEYAGRSSREIAIDMSMGMTSRSRMFVVGDRLFTVGTVTRKDETKADRIEKFFASFQLLDDAGSRSRK